MIQGWGHNQKILTLGEEIRKTLTLLDSKQQKLKKVSGHCRNAHRYCA